jgi:hypothetical protein
VKKFNLNFNESEYEYRLGVYENNLKIIDSINSNPLNTFVAGETKFAYLTKQEYLERIMNPSIVPNTIQWFSKVSQSIQSNPTTTSTSTKIADKSELKKLPFSAYGGNHRPTLSSTKTTTVKQSIQNVPLAVITSSYSSATIRKDI